MAWYRNLRMIYKIMFPVGALLVVFLGILTWQIQSKSSDAIQSVAERELAAVAGQYGNAVKSFFELALNESQGLADAVAGFRAAGRNVPRETLIAMIMGLEKGNEAFVAAGSAWEPGAYDGRDAAFAAPGAEPGKKAKPTGNDENGRFIPYVVNGELTILEDLETSDYYKMPKQRKRTTLTSPYFYTVGGKQILMTTASAAVVENGQFKGIVLLDISLDTVAAVVENISIYKNGWGAVITQEGIFVAHKNKELVNTSLFDTPLVVDADKVRKEMGEGKPFIRLRDAGEGMSFYYYFPITLRNTGQTWYFMVSAPMNEVLEEARMISALTVGICAAVLACSLLLIFIVVRITVRPLGVLAEVAKVIAGGDLRVSIRDEGFGGEMKELSSSLKEMIASLITNIERAEAMSKDAREQASKAQEAMAEAEKARAAAENAKREGMLAAAGQLEDVVGIISSASENLSAQIGQSERGAAEQADRVGETATAMDEMNSTVLEVARNAGAASDISAETRSSAEKGSAIVQRAVDGIQSVQRVSLLLKEDMAHLAEQAQSISQIMRVISDIADQTNLLALNAAIEAARAGDAGRGFAVVADEVRKLAEKTMESTSHVGDAIDAVQKSVDQSNARVDEAVHLIEDATAQANMSGEALQGIMILVDNTADQVRVIAAASEQQSATSEAINRSISQINSIAGQTSAAMLDAAQSVSELSRQVQALSHLIEDMKKG